MDSARQHWEILRRVPKEMVNRVRSFMVIGEKGDGVLLLTQSGDGYWLGEMRFGQKSKQAKKPTQINVTNLVSMTHGLRHILLLSESGQIHAMGENNEGQLGLGTFDQNTYFSPQLFSNPHKFTSVRCGYRHSLALTEDGKVWSWGSNVFGQVGVHNSTNCLPSPRKIPELDSHRVVAVECGCFHSLALTSDGNVYVWGANGYGQLGDGSESSKHTPTRITTHSPVQSMAAGYNHTLLLARTGEVFVCGRNEFGQLGLSTEVTKSSASLVKVAGLPPITQIASHFDTSLSIAISTKQECFAWGCLGNTLGNFFTSIPIQFPPIYSTLDSVLSFQSTPRNTSCSVRVEDLQCQQKSDSETQTESLTGTIRLGERASSMFDNPESNPDVKFELEDQAILAHRSVLQISSTYFTRLFSESLSLANQPNLPTQNPKSSFIPLRHTTNPSEPDSQTSPLSAYPQTPLITIPISDHSYPTFHAYINFLYTGTFRVPAKNLTELFELARSHFEQDLEQLCLTRMRSTVSLENCCLYYQLTDRQPLPEFQQELIEFIADNLLQVFSTDAYKSLNNDICRKLTITIGNLCR